MIVSDIILYDDWGSAADTPQPVNMAVGIRRLYVLP